MRPAGYDPEHSALDRAGMQTERLPGNQVSRQTISGCSLGETLPPGQRRWELPMSYWPCASIAKLCGNACLAQVRHEWRQRREGPQRGSVRSFGPARGRTVRSASLGIARLLPGLLLQSSTQHTSDSSLCSPLHWLALNEWSPGWKTKARSYPPNVSSISFMLFMIQVKIGVSRRVKRLPSVSRRAMTRSKKSSGLSVSNATTNS